MANAIFEKYFLHYQEGPCLRVVLFTISINLKNKNNRFLELKNKIVFTKINPLALRPRIQNHVLKNKKNT